MSAHQKLQQRKANKKFLQRVIAVTLVLQAIIIGVKGNIDVLSGKPTLDAIQWMMIQGVELIIKAQRLEKSTKKESDRP